MAKTKETTTDAPRGRGRPRPQEVIDRDEAVYAVLSEARSKSEIAEATGLTPKMVYLSLWRLSRAKRIRLGTEEQPRAWVRLA